MWDTEIREQCWISHRKSHIPYHKFAIRNYLPMPHAPCANRWATATLSVLHWFCQRGGFCAATVFVWLFFWLKYGLHRIFCRQFFPCLFCEIVWLHLDLFLSLASIYLLFLKIDGVSNCEFRLTPPENIFNWGWVLNII